MNPTCEEDLDFSCLLGADETFEVQAVVCRANTMAGTNEKNDGKFKTKSTLQMTDRFPALNRVWTRQPNNPLGRTFALSVPEHVDKVLPQCGSIPVSVRTGESIMHKEKSGDSSTYFWYARTSSARSSSLASWMLMEKRSALRFDRTLSFTSSSSFS